MSKVVWPGEDLSWCYVDEVASRRRDPRQDPHPALAAPAVTLYFCVELPAAGANFAQAALALANVFGSLLAPSVTPCCFRQVVYFAKAGFDLLAPGRPPGGRAPAGSLLRHALNAFCCAVERPPPGDPPAGGRPAPGVKFFTPWPAMHAWKAAADAPVAVVVVEAAELGAPDPHPAATIASVATGTAAA